MKWTTYPADRFGEFRDAWDGLNARGPNSPVQNSAFPHYGLLEFGRGDEQIAVYGDVAEPSAMAIMQRAKTGVWDTFQPSQAPLGAWLNVSEVPLKDLLSELARALPGVVVQIGLTQQDPKFSPRPEGEKKLRTLDYIETAWIPATGTFTDYWAGRGKNLRRNMTRQPKRLANDGVTTRLEVITEVEAVAAGVASYGELESAGWKADGGTAIAPDNAQGRFYTKLLEEFCGRGQGALYQFFFDDALVATDLCVDQGGDFVILKTTYDETIRHVSPAFIMRHQMFPSLFDNERIDTIEFYGKQMDWHTKWSEHSRTLYHLNMRRFL